MTRTLFTNGRIFDGTGAAVSDGDVVVAGGRIVEVGTGLDGDEAVDLGGRTLFPGFFDCHTHVMISHVNVFALIQQPFSLSFFEATHNLRRTLATGITSVRDAGGADLGVKTAVDTGLTPGPRMQISLSMIGQTGGHGDGWMPSGNRIEFMPSHPGRPDAVVDGVDEMQKKVRELIMMGADVIKVATSGGVLSPRDDPRHAHFTIEELQMLVDTAAGLGRWVMAHAQATDGIKNAIRAGIRSIDHGIYLDDEAIEMMLARGTFLVPTLVAPNGVIRAAEAGAAIPEASVRKAYEVVDIHRDAFARAVKAGVTVAMGTDSGVTPHGDNLEELELMVAGGMTPTDAWVATTRNAAACMDVASDRGTIQEGLRADLVVLDGDPMDVTGLRDRVAAVYLDGVLASGGI